MLLYDAIKRQIGHLALLSNPMPVSAEVIFNIEWLGYVDDVMVVTIKEDSKTQGWLYGNAAFVFFNYNGILYEVRLPDLKDAVQSALIDKKFVSEPEKPPVAGFMEKFPAGKILGYVATNEIIAISKKVE